MTKRQATDPRDIPFRDLAGKTIATVEIIQAEFGRTYESYVLITTVDGLRAYVHSGLVRDSIDRVWSDDRWRNPKPSIEQMRKAPSFFAPEDIGERAQRDEVESRARALQDRAEKQRHIERLQRELEEDA